MSLPAYEHLEDRPHLWRRQLWIRGTRLTAAAVAERAAAEGPQAAAEALGLPIEVVEEAIAYSEQSAALIASERAEDARLDAAMRSGGLHRECPPENGPAIADVAVIGLGNPLERLEGSPHNLGFNVIREVARRRGASFEPDPDLLALVATVQHAGRRAVLVLPQTFMNDSGRALHAVAHRFYLPAAEMLVVYDDLALPMGTLRLRAAGSAGTHNGMRNCVAFMGEGFPRLRLGIDPGAVQDRYEYVLTPLAPGLRAVADAMVVRAADSVEVAIESGFVAAATRSNGPGR